jgi:Lar family restriction alleviation protein
MPENKLKPCPFCGGDAEVHITEKSEPAHYCEIVCTSCGARTARHLDYLINVATYEWNRRKTNEL